jgi:putative DNA-invertase from lambdoid prophage Rac
MGADGLHAGVSSEQQTSESQLPAAAAVQVALYTRVSTTDQNCVFQLRELRDCAVHRGWQVVEVYQDILSGAQARRPGLSRLMANAASRKFNCLMVWKLDRFGRSLVDCLNNIQMLETYGVRFVAVTQGLDTDQRNPTSRFLLHVLGAAAELARIFHATSSKEPPTLA